MNTGDDRDQDSGDQTEPFRVDATQSMERLGWPTQGPGPVPTGSDDTPVAAEVAHPPTADEHDDTGAQTPGSAPAGSDAGSDGWSLTAASGAGDADPMAQRDADYPGDGVTPGPTGTGMPVFGAGAPASPHWQQPMAPPVGHSYAHLPDPRVSSAGAPWGSATPGYGAPPTRPRRERRRGLAVPLVAIIALLAGVIGGAAAPWLSEQLGWAQEGPRPVVAEVAAPVMMPESGQPASVAAIAQAVLPSVVFISVQSSEGSGVGSGFVVREDGYIVTNAHVIAGANDGEVTVRFDDGDSFPAEVVGTDTAYDIAVLKVDADGLPALAFGDSSALQVGESVVAVGAPLGLDSTVTLGIVSALERPVSTGQGANASFINAIQTDAAINPGNSGGPLVDLRGRVIGVNSALAQIPESAVTGPVGNIGLGFAIPAQQAEYTAQQLIDTGTSDYPVIGVLVDTSYSGPGARVLPEDTENLEEGTEIIAPGGAAEEAGIQPGDILLSVDGRPIEDSQQLIVVLRSYRVGDTVEIVVRNGDGDERTVSMTLRGSQD